MSNNEREGVVRCWAAAASIPRRSFKSSIIARYCEMVPSTSLSRVEAEFPVIDVKRGGALVTSDWSKLIVPRPPNDDYSLTLAHGWEVIGGTVRRAAR